MCMTIKAVANNLGMSCNTVKEINKELLKRKYGRPDLQGLMLIEIDEFAVKKGPSSRPSWNTLRTPH